ncbi:hypothetical protein BC938DRAFT_482434 [Jimgerdemannia flammicorona]|uniref:YCII-related domain-containing protein n=1 Tax=Jimgerdemannia flammicorona TaxID=994334 RepID=A0A433QW93_9FUNG|nr:hypothetical protein BC938DRAFT_482434 [Jimgerdemannia flammicorona]
MLSTLLRPLSSSFPHTFTGARAFTASAIDYSVFLISRLLNFPPIYLTIPASKQQFLVIAYDYTDAEALARRLAVRPAHLALATEDKKAGLVLSAGAILDSHEGGKMIGSSIIFESDSEQEVHDHVARDPYVTGKVWERWEVLPYLL